jgi:hypothetical protein
MAEPLRLELVGGPLDGEWCTLAPGQYELEILAPLPIPLIPWIPEDYEPPPRPLRGRYLPALFQSRRMRAEGRRAERVLQWDGWR